MAHGCFLSLADIDQLKRIMEVVGTPSPEVLAKISSEHVSLLTRPPGPPALWRREWYGRCVRPRGAWGVVKWSPGLDDLFSRAWGI